MQNNKIRKLTQAEIISTLDRLNIEHEKEANSKGFLDILCPNKYHDDTHFGNCGINLNSGKIQCFACGYGSKELGTKSIYDVVKERFNINFFNAFKFITCEEINDIDYEKYNLEIKKKKLRQKRKEYFESKEKKRTKRKVQIYTGISKDLEPEKYKYTKDRGFTKDFCEYFEIKHALSYPYENYIIIPIIDYNLNIFTFEARKLLKNETVIKYYNSKDIYFKNEKRYLIQLKRDIKNYGWKWDKKNYCVKDRNEKIVINEYLKYILKPKTLYPKEFLGYKTLFNIENLDFSKPLYVVEGIGSVAKIWTYISKNVTCTFGSNLSKEQLEYLKLFSEVILIPDNDLAGGKMSWNMSAEIKNLKIIQSYVDDTHKDYILNILNAEYIKPIKFAIEMGYV